jgi:hypothetical protein
MLTCWLPPQLPTMVPPEEYIHPYSQRSLLWQWSFTIQRALYLLYLMCPLAVHSMRLLIWDGDIAIRDRWCELHQFPPTRCIPASHRLFFLLFESYGHTPHARYRLVCESVHACTVWPLDLGIERSHRILTMLLLLPLSHPCCVSRRGPGGLFEQCWVHVPKVWAVDVDAT